MRRRRKKRIRKWWEPYGGTRYDQETKDAACQFRREGLTYPEIRRLLHITAQDRTLISWFKAAGVYDPPEEQNP